MNGATLLSATVVVNSSANKTNDQINYINKTSESNDENDDSESDSDEEEFIEFDDSSNIRVNNDISNSNDPNCFKIQSSEQVSYKFYIQNKIKKIWKQRYKQKLEKILIKNKILVD